MDFSRHVNKFIKDQPVRLAHLEEAEKLLEEGDYQTVYSICTYLFVGYPLVKLSDEEKIRKDGKE